MKYLKRNHTTHPRLSVLVSKKVSKKAVVRNRIRRRLMVAARPHIEQIQEPYDFVISVYDIGYATKPWDVVDATTKNLFEKFK